ncbi:hypothetical protein BJY00DRAFT_279071 [Aspergillus carlsbadensis]|nr:hypothetical protein BJY00DRAFT_279071 [Aspergillus carlsbadensis]
MDGDNNGSILSGPYNPETFALQLSRITSRYLEPDAQVRPELIRKPGPFTLYLGFWGTASWRAAYASFLAIRLQGSSFEVDRALTQPEVDAHVESHDKIVSNLTRGIPLGFFTGGAKWFLYEGMYKHFLHYAPPAGQPGMTPLRRFAEGSKQLFRFNREHAKLLCISLVRRVVLYTTVAGIAFPLVGGIMATQQLLRDPRMAQHVEDARKVSPERVKALRGQAEKERAARQARAIKERLAQRNQAQPSEEPAPQHEGYDQSGHEMDSVRMNSATAPSTIAYPSSMTETAPAARTSSYGYRAPAEQNKGTGFFDDDDDASPTAPEYRGTARRDNATPGQGGAWERLRNQSQSGIPSGSGSASAGGSAWTQSEASVAASDSQRERERAQAEFNRLLDAERNQSSDSGGSRGAWR